MQHPQKSLDERVEQDQQVRLQKICTATDSEDHEVERNDNKSAQEKPQVEQLDMGPALSLEEDHPRPVQRAPSQRRGSANVLRRKNTLPTTNSVHAYSRRSQPDPARQIEELKSQVRHLEEQNALLSTQVLQLQPHRPSVSYEQLRALYSSLHGESQKFCGGYFECPDLADKRHRQLVHDRDDLRLVRQYGSDVFTDLARAAVIKAVVYHSLEGVFEGVKNDLVGDGLFRSLRRLGQALLDASVDKQGLVPVLIDMRADTAHVLVREFLGLDPGAVIENASSSSFRLETVSKCQRLKVAAAVIMEDVEIDLQPYMLRSVGEGDGQTPTLTKATKRSLERLVATAMFLVLNMRLSRQLLVSTKVGEDQSFDAEYMEPFGDGGDLGSCRRVMFAVDHALRVFDDQARVFRCVQKATVILKPGDGKDEDQGREHDRGSLETGK